MRPKITCHMISSIDGRLQPSRWTPPANGISPDLKSTQYEEVATRLNGDGWMVGRVTMQGYAKGHADAVDIPAGDLRTTFIAPGEHSTVAVAIDPHGKLEYRRRHRDAGRRHGVAALCGGTDLNDAARVKSWHNGCA